MPKIGATPIRKAALITATIAEVGRAGTLDVTVAQIARRAGMSPALAHHYFGSKDQIFLAAMRHILANYGKSVRAALRRAGPDGRLDAIITASLAPEHFDRDTISAWLNFYALAHVNADAARLLRVYHRRLRSNLIAALRPRNAAPETTADAIGAMIDGLYLRAMMAPPADHAATLRALIAQLTT
ncbi:transcriptional regulator BetI [Paracoccus sp. (in: a-proteobacteria)]|uniref:transcriptional regulator BetI n=1 Tax=Paracoccus sp. TaxID=267 RepID=UPI0026DF5EB8|nr:transcriptional regulator BetI [Paracoccus sp. (in: a-proteobacteria)]MDO5646868.1 transcriptional regulator BetI [Paracoccus sp. (in: a-proteobacteria)]